MGVKRQQSWPDLICNVVIIGDAKVGKTSLINRAVYDKFSDSYSKTSFHGGSGEKTEWNQTVAGRKVKYMIVDTSGGHRAGLGVSRDSSFINGHPVSHHRSSSSLSLTSCGSSYFESASARKIAAVYQKAAIFLLCYKISDPSTLFSALNFWCPEIRCHSPLTPIVLVGCQSDMRTDRDVLATLARRGLAPISGDQGLTLSQQAGCLLYVETSAKLSPQSASSAFEVAALTLLGQITPKPFSSSTSHLPESPRHITPQGMPPPVPPKPYVRYMADSPSISTGPLGPPKVSTRRALSTMALNTTNDVGSFRDTNEFDVDLYSPDARVRFPHGTVARRQDSNYPQNLRQSCIDLNATTSSSTSSSTASSASSSGVVVSKRNTKFISASRGHIAMTPASPKLSFKTTRDRSVSSLLSIGTTHRTPKVARKVNDEKTVTIRCQRLTADKRYEEVDVEVPAPIYETLRLYNNDEMSANNGNNSGFLTSAKGNNEAPALNHSTSTTDPTNNRKTRSIAERIKSLFGSTSQN